MIHDTHPVVKHSWDSSYSEENNQHELKILLHSGEQQCHFRVMKGWIITAIAAAFLYLFLLQILGYFFEGGVEEIDTDWKPHSAEDLDEEESGGEIVTLKVVTRKRIRRGRRDARGNRYFVVQLIRTSTQKPIQLHLVRRYDVLSPNFRLQSDINDGQQRHKRSDELLQEEFQHSLYTGHISSDDGIEPGWAAVTCIEDSSSLRMFGFFEINGTQHEITPVYTLSDQVDQVQSDAAEDTGNYVHKLREINGQTQRKCSSRRLSRKEMEASPEPEPAVPVPMTNGSVPELDVDVQSQNKPQTAKSTARHRTMELAVFTDPRFLVKLKKRFPEDTLKNAVASTLALVNNVNLMYKNPTLGEDNLLDIRLNHMEMLTKEVKALKMGKGREDIYLTSFCNFAYKKNMKSVGWDHAMMLTGWDLRDTESNGVIGVAYTAAMCNRYHSCSLIEATNFLGSYTMAHELGHSLGMPHDGEESSARCNPTTFIMAAIEGPGQIDWSSCSAQNLRDFLRGRSSMPEASRPGCLRTSLKRNRLQKPISYTPKKRLPGQIFSAAQQCAMTFGKNMSVPKSSPTSICKELQCGNGTSTFGIQPALEGTPCGDTKWCRNGSCVKKRS